MNRMSTIVAKPEVTMIGVHRQSAHRNRGQQGQIIVIAALAMVALIGGVSLILEGGNAYAHQRVAQNAADAVANAGATVLARRLGGDTSQSDASVLAATNAMAAANQLDSYTGYYTNVTGALLDAAGLVTTNIGTASQVGPADGVTTIPPGTQGIRIGGSQAFGTTFARAIGISQFTASAEAAAVTGALTGGVVLPIVFPVSMESCDGTGDSIVIDESWRLERSQPGRRRGTSDRSGIHRAAVQDRIRVVHDPRPRPGQGLHGRGQQPLIHPVLRLPSQRRHRHRQRLPEEDRGSDRHPERARHRADDPDLRRRLRHFGGQRRHLPHHPDGRVLRRLHLVLERGDTTRRASATISPTYGTSIVQITGGNASSSCLAGWFVRYVTSGPVGSGSINNGEAIGVQLIR